MHNQSKTINYRWPMLMLTMLMVGLLGFSIFNPVNTLIVVGLAAGFVGLDLLFNKLVWPLLLNRKLPFQTETRLNLSHFLMLINAMLLSMGIASLVPIPVLPIFLSLAILVGYVGFTYYCSNSRYADTNIPALSLALTLSMAGLIAGSILTHSAIAVAAFAFVGTIIGVAIPNLAARFHNFRLSETTKLGMLAGTILGLTLGFSVGMLVPMPIGVFTAFPAAAAFATAAIAVVLGSGFGMLGGMIFDRYTQNHPKAASFIKIGLAWMAPGTLAGAMLGFGIGALAFTGMGIMTSIFVGISVGTVLPAAIAMLLHAVSGNYKTEANLAADDDDAKRYFDSDAANDTFAFTCKKLNNAIFTPIWNGCVSVVEPLRSCVSCGTRAEGDASNRSQTEPPSESAGALLTDHL